MSSEKHIEFRAILILEILGRPKEHLVASLEEYIEKINSEKGVTVYSKKINEPQELEKKKDVYTTFAEIEIKFDELFTLMMLVFKYMPSHVELINPERASLTANDFSTLLNELTRRLHGYEELARIFQFEKKMLENKIAQFSGNANTQISEVKEDNLKEKPKKKSKK
ncbi:MAG: hypothetical protein WC812_04600 [Candidatus Pacearchaeota archaeon]|jgi:hypothetical protein